MDSVKRDIVLNFFFSVLLFTAFTSGFIIELGIISVNLSQIVSLLLFLLLMIYSALNKRQAIVLYQDLPSLFIYFYFFSNLFSSIIFSPVKFQSLKGCVIILSYILIYVTIRWAAKLLFDKKRTIQQLLRFNNYSVVFGISCMLFSFANDGQLNIGVSLGQLGTAGIESIQNPLPSIQSLSIEPNIFAIITGSLVCIPLSAYLMWRKRNDRLFTILLSSAAIVFAYTRSVYVAIFLALFFLIIVAKRIRLIVSTAKYALIIIAFIGTVMILLPKDHDVKKALVSRATSLFDFKSGSGAGRLMGFEMALEGFNRQPLFGNGTLSANTTFYNRWGKQYEERMGSPGWLNGVLIQSMHDTGLIGIVIILALYFSLILENLRVYKRLTPSVEKWVVLGFIGGNIVIIVASQASSTLWVSFPYIYWGLNMAYLSSCKKKYNHNTASMTLQNS